MTSIFVAKLDFNTTDEQLRSLFEQHGKVNRVTIAKDRETGKPRGFAFVEMFNEAEADSAIEALDNATVNGRQIAVKKADDRGARPAGAPGQRPERTDRPPRDNNRFENRPPRTEGFTPRPQSDERPTFRQPEESSPKPFSDDKPFKTERKKEKKDIVKKSLSDQPKPQKMEAYRKSGKDNQFLDDDDLSDEELDLFGRNEEDEEDEDYRKYLVNSDDDDDDFVDDDYEDDEEIDDED